VCGQNLSGVHSVYLLPMSRALDPYLANRLTNQRVFQVVTDSKLADAVVFTDRSVRLSTTNWRTCLGNP
jgi:hypothetical protein